MSYDELDVEYDDGMSALYAEFTQQYEASFILERVGSFYKKFPEVGLSSFQNFIDSQNLLKNEFITPAFIQAVISIEVGIKSVVLKPILYSLAINDEASNLLYELTFERKSLQAISSFYYNTLEEVSGWSFKDNHRDNVQQSIETELKELQKIRNTILHQGIIVEKEGAQKAIDIASYVFEKIIPTILDKFLCHFDKGVIKNGSSVYAVKMKELKNKKQS